MCRTDTELICEDTYRSDVKLTLSHCYDQEDCKLYGDCCRNSAHYAEREQTAPTSVAGEVYNNSRYGCYRVDPADPVPRLMIGNCPAGADREVRDRCETSDAGRDFVSRFPVTGADTGHVYRNAYCAWCRGERRRVVYWKPVFACLGSDGRVAAEVRLENASDHTLLYRLGRWYYADYDRRILLPCKFRLEQPPGADVRPLRPCDSSREKAGLVDGCPAGTSDELARACASHSYTLFEYKSGAKSPPRVFRNADCARCNNVTADRLTCAPPKPALTYLPFSSLFDVKAAGEPCGPHELYDVPAAKCRDVFRDELSTLCGTYAEFGPGEYDGRSLDDETAYVYAYRKRVRHRNGPVAATGVPLEVCAEDADGLPLRPDPPLPAFASYLAGASVFGSSVSAVALTAHLALFRRSPGPKKLPEKNLAGLAVSLLLGYGGYLAIASGAVRPGANLPCLASAFAVHFGFLAAFAWTFVMSADVWIAMHASAKKLRVAGGKRNGRFAAYSAFAWLTSLALAAFAAALQLSAVRALPGLRPNFQYDCWFRNPRSLVALFVLPAGVIVAANYVSFACVVRLIAASDDGWLESSAAAAGRTRKNLKIYVRLSLMMGLAWALGLVGAVTDSDVAWTAYTVLNSFHGAFVFVAFDNNCWRTTTERTLAAFRKLPSVSETQTTVTTAACAPHSASA